MNIIDDPMLILIARFVGADRDRGVSEQAFLQRQIEAIESYVGAFPREERNVRAREWIENHAENYRENWLRKHLPNWLRGLRCPDCPLADGHAVRTCSIHQQWSDLLTRYASEEISSREYVEQTLKLLSENKEQLKRVSPAVDDKGR